MIQIKWKQRVSRLLCLLLCLALCVGGGAVFASAASREQSKYAGLKLIPGGEAFGVRFDMAGVLVVGFCDVDTKGGNVCPASQAGLREGDVIKSVDGKQMQGAGALVDAVSSAQGNEVSVTFNRSGVEKTVRISPEYSVSESKYKVGVCVRDSGAGIGTVTYIYPSTYSFAGLGHGICSSDGRLVQMTRGAVCDVTVSGVKKGVAGTPGEIKGIFGTHKLGTLVGNTSCGVYGMFSECPCDESQAIEIGTRGEVKNGSAYIMCTLDSEGIGRYGVEISSIKHDEHGSKCFIVTVKDEKLIEKTGGIVQGMSGSPIIQDGKLIGAVTHVMINDPTVGYGIFIENMLDNMPEVLR